MAVGVGSMSEFSGIGSVTDTTISGGGRQYVGIFSSGIGTAIITTILHGGAQYLGDISGGVGTATSTTPVGSST